MSFGKDRNRLGLLVGLLGSLGWEKLVPGRVCRSRGKGWEKLDQSCPGLLLNQVLLSQERAWSQQRASVLPSLVVELPCLSEGRWLAMRGWRLQIQAPDINPKATTTTSPWSQPSPHDNISLILHLHHPQPCLHPPLFISITPGPAFVSPTPRLRHPQLLHRRSRTPRMPPAPASPRGEGAGEKRRREPA